MRRNKEYTFEELLPFLREVVGSPHWKWADGMLCRHPKGVFEPWRYDSSKTGTSEQSSAGVPDLDDPVTAGAIVARLVELAPAPVQVGRSRAGGYEVWLKPIARPPRTRLLGWGASCGIAAAWALCRGIPEVQIELSTFWGSEEDGAH